MFKDGHTKEGLQPRQRGRGHGGRGTSLGRGSRVRTPKKIRTEECCWVSLIRKETADNLGRRSFRGVGAGGGEARLQWVEKSPEVTQWKQ